MNKWYHNEDDVSLALIGAFALVMMVVAGL